MLKEQQELIKILMEKAGNTTNVYTTNCGNTTTNTQNNNNNIQINGFGKEDITYLTETNKTTICESIYGSVAKCIEAVHLNDKHPKNKNIRMRSHKKQKWQITDLMEEVRELIDLNYDRVVGFYDDGIKEKLKPQRKKINRK